MVVVNNQIVEGSQNLAGEIGHITIDYKGDKCTCGAIGCIETLASGWGIAKRAKVKTAKEALEKGVSSITEDALLGLSLLIKSLINLNNPDKVILGGGLLEGYLSIYPDFMTRLEKMVKNQALKSYKVKLFKSQLSDLSPALGAASFALESFKNRI
ncbi:MAG: ROK family protein, partial [Parachlamydiaceae bacterium]